MRPPLRKDGRIVKGFNRIRQINSVAIRFGFHPEETLIRRVEYECFFKKLDRKSFHD